MNYNDIFEYKDGGLFWKKTSSKRYKIGDRAGHLSKNGTGERKVFINKKPTLEKYIIYNMFYGDIPDGFEIHRHNMMLNDNRIENLYLKEKPEVYRHYKLSKELIDQYIYIKDGEIYRVYGDTKTGRVLKNSYYMITIGPRTSGKKSKRFLEHKVIWMYYNGDIPDGFEIDHINQDKLDNRIENLRCVPKHVNLSNNKAKNYSYNKKYKIWKCEIMRNGVVYRTRVKTEADAKRWVEEIKNTLII